MNRRRLLRRIQQGHLHNIDFTDFLDLVHGFGMIIHMIIYWSDEDKAYIGHAPDLEGCAAHGRTPEEALTELQVAIHAWLDTARKYGDVVPTPTARPEFMARA